MRCSAAQVIWKDTGWAMIMFLAALTQIDSQLYEAAGVDGAGRWRQLWHITVPGMRGRDHPAADPAARRLAHRRLRADHPAADLVGRDASEVLDTYVYYTACSAGQWGVAAAVGLVKGVVGVALVIGANKVAHSFGEPGVYRKP